MSLPSKYSREGLSIRDQHRTITTGAYQRKAGPATYKVRLALPNTPTLDNDGPSDDEMLRQHWKHNKAHSPQFVYEHHARHLNYVPDNAVHPYLEPTQAQQYLVVDTNFVLSHLDILFLLMEICAQYLQIIIIPYEVVYELDGLKNSRKVETRVGSGKYTIGQLARQAIDWIYFCLAEGVLTVRGQAAHEKIDPILVKDEAILDCCIYFRRNFPEALTVLLSNDKNLCAKALSSSVPTVSYREGMSADKIAEAIHVEYGTRFGASESATAADAIEVDSEERPNDNLDSSNGVAHDLIEVDMAASRLPPGQNLSPSSSSLLDPAVACITVHKEIKQLVISMVKRAISQAYGDDRSLIPDYNEAAITTFYMAAKTLTRFWRQVFKYLLPGCRPYVTVANVREPIMFEAPENADQLRKFIDFWYQILHLLYEKLMTPDQIEALHLLKKRWDQLANF